MGVHCYYVTRSESLGSHEKHDASMVDVKLRLSLTIRLRRRIGIMEVYLHTLRISAQAQVPAAAPGALQHHSASALCVPQRSEVRAASRPGGRGFKRWEGGANRSPVSSVEV
jgi:hypothetical protein